MYTDGYGIPYTDGNGDIYYSNEGSLYLSGGSVNINEENIIKITKVGNDYKLYVNNILVDSETSTDVIGGTSDTNIYLGVSNNSYYNSGSITNLYIYNTTTSAVVLNDSLKSNTIGTNNGVKFI